MMRFELKGLRETLRKLQGMEKSIGRRALRKGIRAGGAALRKISKRYAPKGESGRINRVGRPGLLRSSLSSVVSKMKRVNRVVAVIGPRRGIKVNNGNPAFTAHLSEGGAKPHRIMPRGGKKVLWWQPKGSGILLPAGGINHPGAKPQAWLRRASVFGSQAAISAFRQKVAADVLAQAAKAKPSEVDDGA